METPHTRTGAVTVYADATRLGPRWDHHELDSSHWVTFGHPDEVEAIIVGER